jgi:hypothetical protein
MLPSESATNRTITTIKYLALMSYSLSLQAQESTKIDSNVIEVRRQ